MVHTMIRANSQPEEDDGIKGGRMERERKRWGREGEKRKAEYNCPENIQEVFNMYYDKNFDDKLNKTK